MLNAIFNDPMVKPFYEDEYTFELDGVKFVIRCRISQTGVTYFPDAINKDGVAAHGRMLPWRNTFNDLNFARLEDWLVHAIPYEHGMFTEAQKKTRHEPARPPELHIPLWELPDIQYPLRRWAKEHPFIGREREVFRRWQNRRGKIEIVQYRLQETPHLEVSTWNAETKAYETPERLAGYRSTLEPVAEEMAKVAGMSERSVKMGKKRATHE
jgi:hypothetical protein